MTAKNWPQDLPHAMMRGFRCRCPACGEGKLFRGYLKVERVCEACGPEYGLDRAADAPPYFTILLVLTLLLLPRVKGAVVGAHQAIATRDAGPEAP
jgi:uncharacterized protein (DUF983 family)